jgi:hypothetical protein
MDGVNGGMARANERYLLISALVCQRVNASAAIVAAPWGWSCWAASARLGAGNSAHDPANGGLSPTPSRPRKSETLR